MILPSVLSQPLLVAHAVGQLLVKIYWEIMGVFGIQRSLPLGWLKIS